MRNLLRNQRKIYYATLLRTEPIKDEWGNDTLEVKKIYSNPIELKVNYSSNVGEDTTRVFGNATSYSRTISYIAKSCPLKENDIVWLGIDTTNKANYQVLKVADSLNSYLIALGEVI